MGLFFKFAPNPITTPLTPLTPMSSLKSNYIILKEQSLIIECHSGNLDLESYINFVTGTTLNPLFSPNLNYLIDFRNVVITAHIDDIKKYNSFSDNTFKSEIKRKVAIVTDTPTQMVFSTLFKDSNTQILKKIEIFSTTKVAINWLNLNINKNEILDILTTFKNHANNKQLKTQY